MQVNKKVFLAACLLAVGLWTDADTVNALAPYDNTQNTAFWNTTERTDGVTASAQSSTTVTLAGASGDMATLAAAFDSRPGTSVTSVSRSLRTTKPVALYISIK